MPLETFDQAVTHAPLTAAEAFVLLDPPGSKASEALKIAFLALVAQGALKITMTERISLLRRRSRVPVVTLGAPPRAMFLVGEIINIVRNADGSSSGADFKAIAKSAVKFFGPGVTQIKTAYILPALLGRGLLAPMKQKFLLVFNRTEYTPTPAGLAEQDRIATLLRQARRLPELTRSDPAEATAIVLAAGSLLLLVDELKGHYGELARLDIAAPNGIDIGDFISFGDDLASFDFSSFDFDFSSFDSSFDSSFSDGGGGDGGDGGDGGGGGH